MVHGLSASFIIVAVCNSAGLRQTDLWQTIASAMLTVVGVAHDVVRNKKLYTSNAAWSWRYDRPALVRLPEVAGHSLRRTIGP